jgi:hypothetical protein
MVDLLFIASSHVDLNNNNAHFFASKVNNTVNIQSRANHSTNFWNTKCLTTLVISHYKFEHDSIDIEGTKLIAMDGQSASAAMQN